ncbi:MAG: hypothetical protein HGA54_07385, partial [Actinobacteria bacterium]|nr:hypothetical protein [Actinomycetota bacterium]
MSQVLSNKRRALIALLVIALVLGENTAFNSLEFLGVAFTPMRVIVPLITLYLLACRVREKRISELRISKVFVYFCLLMVFWVIWIIFQTIIIPEIGTGVAFFKILSYAFILMAGYCAWELLRTKEAFSFAIMVFRIMLAGLVAFAFFEILTDIHPFFSQFEDPIFLNSDSILYSMGADPRWYVCTGICYNPNDYCALMAVIAAICLPRTEETKKTKIFATVLFLVTLIVVSGVGATLVTLGILAAALVWLLFSGFGWKKNIICFAGVFFTSEFLSSWFMKATQWIVKRYFGDAGRGAVDPLSEFGQHLANYSAGDGSLWNRIHMYIDMVKSLPDSYGLGFGPGQVIRYFEMNPSQSGLLNPHNWWLEVPVTYGLAVFCAYIGLLVYLVVRLVKKWRISKWSGFAVLVCSYVAMFRSEE